MFIPKLNVCCSKHLLGQGLFEEIKCVSKMDMDEISSFFDTLGNDKIDSSLDKIESHSLQTNS